MRCATRLRMYLEALMIIGAGQQLFLFSNQQDIITDCSTTHPPQEESTITKQQAYYSESLGSSTTTTMKNLVNQKQMLEQSPPSDRLGDGCYHVFIDAGSNRGVHGRFLFEPEKYTNSTFVGKFDEFFGGHRTKQNMCVFAFEPNPRHEKPQTATQEAYRKMGWRYHYMPFGVGDHDGNLTFYRNQDFLGGSANEDWGFSTILIGKEKHAQKVSVRVIDFAAWSEKHIFNRTIPEQNEFNPSGAVVALKMDVEGSEFRTIYRMDQLGTACKFDHIVGELHYNSIPAPPENYTLDMTTPPTVRVEARKVIKNLFREGCPKWIYFDDESYLHDGMPYPEPL